LVPRRGNDPRQRIGVGFTDRAASLAAYRGSVGRGPENRTLLSRLMRPDGSPDRYPHQRCEAFTHSRAAGWFGRQKIWRKAEVSIPNALRRPSRFERAPGTRRIDFPLTGGRLRTRSSSVTRPFAFQATLAPWPVSLPWRRREVSSPTRCRAHRFQNGPSALLVTPP
jgi:hypothetical protein